MKGKQTDSSVSPPNQPDWKTFIPNGSPKDFELWVEKFNKHRLGAAAIKQLNDNDDGSARFWNMRYKILESCFAAYQFDPTLDQWSHKRLQDTNCLNEITEQVEAIKKLRNFALKYPAASGFAFMSTKQELQNRITISSVAGKQSLNEMFSLILESYAKHLEPPIPFIRNGPIDHRFRYACLLYAEPIDPHHFKFPTIATLLAADLVYLFRIFSLGHEVCLRGLEMPESGDSCNKLVAKFTNATLSSSLTTKNVSDNVRNLVDRNAGIRFMGWN